MTLISKYKIQWCKQDRSNDKFATVLAKLTPSERQKQVLRSQHRDHWPPDFEATRLLKEDEAISFCEERLGSEYFLQLQLWQELCWSPKGRLCGCLSFELISVNSIGQRGLVGFSSYYSYHLCRTCNVSKFLPFLSIFSVTKVNIDIIDIINFRWAL